MLAGLSRQFLAFHGRYHKFFQRHTVNLSEKAFQYLKGLFQADKKNMERMEERVAETVYDPLQYIPMLSCPDVATLLKSVLPRKDVTEEEVLRQLEVRHRKRQASIGAAYRKQQKDGLLPLVACSPK